MCPMFHDRHIFGQKFAACLGFANGAGENFRFRPGGFENDFGGTAVVRQRFAGATGSRAGEVNPLRPYARPP